MTGIKKCEHLSCDATFAPCNSKHRFCSRKCQSTDYAAAYYARNPDAKAAYMAAYRAQNRDALHAYNAAYRAARRTPYAAITACQKCGKELAPRTGGGGWNRRYCSQRCQQLARRARNRVKAIAYLGGRCVNCGSTNDLQFDHREQGTRRFCITERIGGRWSTIEAELVKCQLLCFECHARKHEAECPQAAALIRGGARWRKEQQHAA